jgi:hypothetical protein
VHHSYIIVNANKLYLMNAKRRRLKMSKENPGLALLEKKIDELGLRREVEDELAQILIEHKKTGKVT